MYPASIEELLPSRKQLFESINSQTAEWVQISQLVNYSLSWLVHAYGISAADFLRKAINYEDFDLKTYKPQYFNGILAYMDLSKLNDFLIGIVDSEEYVIILNKCIEIIHREISLMRGDIITLENSNYIFLWNFLDNEVFEEIATDSQYQTQKLEVLQAKGELAFTSLVSCLFKLRIYLKSYCYRVHDILTFNFQGLVTVGVHTATGFKGPVGGSQKVDISILSKSLYFAKKFADHARKLKFDLILTREVGEMLSRNVVFRSNWRHLSCFI